MIRIPCPHCGPRNSSEFRYVGTRSTRPDVATANPATWRRHLYVSANTLGWVTETWFHAAGCRQFVEVQRHTETDETRP